MIKKKLKYQPNWYIVDLKQRNFNDFFYWSEADISTFSFFSKCQRKMSFGNKNLNFHCLKVMKAKKIELLEWVLKECRECIPHLKKNFEHFQNILLQIVILKQRTFVLNTMETPEDVFVRKKNESLTFCYLIFDVEIFIKY